MDDVETKIVEIISKKAEIDTDKIKYDMNISEVGLPSLDFIEMIFMLEEEFDIEIPQSADLVSIGDFINTVKDLISQNAKEPA